MDRLISILGPAPSEDPVGFHLVLKKERARMAEGFQGIRDRRNTISKGGQKKKKVNVGAKLKTLLNGIDDVDDFFAFVAAEKAKLAGGKSE